MKKVILILASASLVIFASCDKKTETQTTTEKTIVVEKDAPEPEVVPVPVEPVDDNGTTINVGKDGVEFSNKDGKGNTEVNINTNKDK